MARNTILISGDAREETRLADLYVMTPGMLAELADAGTVIPHSTDGGQADPIFVREQWENDGAGIDDNVAIDDECTLLFVAQGTLVNAYTSDTILEGERVCSDGAGGVRLADSGDYVMGTAKEDSDLSGTNGRVLIYVWPSGVSA